MTHFTLARQPPQHRFQHPRIITNKWWVTKVAGGLGQKKECFKQEGISTPEKNYKQLFKKKLEDFSPGAHPAAETPFYIAAASVSARGDAQCVWSHESSISSSYEKKHGSARSHIFTSVKTRRVKLVKLETNCKQKEKQSIAKLTRRPQFLQSTLAQLSSVLCESWVYASYFSRVALRNWLCASWFCTSLLGAMCFARTAPRDFSRKWSAQAALFQAAARKLLCKLLHASALCKLLCASALSKLLCASALRQLLRASALRMCSVQVGLCKLLCASALCKCSVQVALRKLLCASDSAQVALSKCCRLWECTSRTVFCN